MVVLNSHIWYMPTHSLLLNSCAGLTGRLEIRTIIWQKSSHVHVFVCYSNIMNITDLDAVFFSTRKKVLLFFLFLKKNIFVDTH